MSIGLIVGDDDGSEAYAETCDTHSKDVVDTTLDRLPGEWVMEATTTPGCGSSLTGLSS